MPNSHSLEGSFHLNGGHVRYLKEKAPGLVPEIPGKDPSERATDMDLSVRQILEYFSQIQEPEKTNQLEIFFHALAQEYNQFGPEFQVGALEMFVTSKPEIVPERIAALRAKMDRLEQEFPISEYLLEETHASGTYSNYLRESIRNHRNAFANARKQLDELEQKLK